MPPQLYGGRWEIIRQVNEGGQSHVFLVHDRTGQFEQNMILKRLRNVDRIDRFEREIAAGQSLRHPLIAPIHDYSLEERPYFVTTNYPGPCLSEYAPLDPLAALELFIKLCDAVSYAHGQGVIHRDIKPENIILDNEREPMILDFGLCYFKADEGERATATMEQVGSRFFMAPEHERGRLEDVREEADTYALGKVLYFLLTGTRLPRENFTGDNDLSLVCENRQLEYVSRMILSRSLTESPDDRVSASELMRAAQDVVRLISEHYYPGRVGSVCRFCGEAEYVEMGSYGMRLSYPTGSGDIDFEAVRCPACGNVQWFIPGR